MSTILPIFTLLWLTSLPRCASPGHTPFNIIHLIRTRDNDNHSQHVERPASTGADENESHPNCGMPMRMTRIRPLRMVVGWEPLSFTQKEKKNYFSAWHEERILPGKSPAFVHFANKNHSRLAYAALPGPPLQVNLYADKTRFYADEDNSYL